MVNGIGGVCFIFGIIEHHHIVLRGNLAIRINLHSEDQPLIEGVGNIVLDDRKPFSHHCLVGELFHASIIGSRGDQLVIVRIAILHGIGDACRMRIGKGEDILHRRGFVGFIFHGDGVAGQRRVTAGVEVSIQLVQRIAHLWIEGAGIALIGIAGGISRDLPVELTIRRQVHIGACLTTHRHRKGLVVVRCCLPGGGLQRRCPLGVRLPRVQGIVDQIGLRRMGAPVCEDIQIPCDRYILRRVSCLFASQHIEPTAELIVVSGVVFGIIHRSHPCAVRDFFGFNEIGLTARFLVGQHIVIGLEETDGACDRRPLGVERDISGGHGVTRMILRAVIAAGGVIPAAEGIGASLQLAGIRRILGDMRGQRGLVRQRNCGHRFVVIVQRQRIGFAFVEKLRRIGFSAVARVGIILLVLVEHFKAMQCRLRLMTDVPVVVCGVDGFDQLVIRSFVVVDGARCFAVKDRYIQLIQPLPRLTPLNISAVTEIPEEIDLVRRVLRDLVGAIQQVFIQPLEHTLDGGVIVVKCILHLEFAVPAGQIGVVAPLAAAHILVCPVSGVSTLHRDTLKAIAGPKRGQIGVKSSFQLKVIVGVAVAVPRTLGVFAIIFVLQLRLVFDVSPVVHRSQQVLHIVGVRAMKGRTLIAKGVGGAAYQLKLVGIFVFPRIEKPQRVGFSVIIHINGG